MEKQLLERREIEQIHCLADPLAKAHHVVFGYLIRDNKYLRESTITFYSKFITDFSNKTGEHFYSVLSVVDRQIQNQK